MRGWACPPVQTCAATALSSLALSVPVNIYHGVELAGPEEFWALEELSEEECVRSTHSKLASFFFTFIFLMGVNVAGSAVGTGGAGSGMF